MSEITQADWTLAAKVMGFDSTEALRRHGHLRALHKQWAERLAAHRATPSQRLDAATVEREGVAPDDPLCAKSCADPRWCTGTGACWRTNEWRDGAARPRPLATEPHQHGGKA